MLSDRPLWVRGRAPTASQAVAIREVRGILDRRRVHTVCQSARCPNAAECWGQGTATFMILGEICTRACRFCAVRTGDPGGKVDEGEPMRVAEAVRELGLEYVVLTSVDRDDLDDGGSGLFAETVTRIKRGSPDAVVEVLIPDFCGDPRALHRILSSGADVIGHNLETVESLTRDCRDHRASYGQSLDVLAYLYKNSRDRRRCVKSGIMLGLGERRREVLDTFADLRDVGVEILTIGQYLAPTISSTPVMRFVPPEEFDELAVEARRLGFRAVVAGPLVRSSYHAAEAYARACG